MIENPKVCILLPALNEENDIGTVVRKTIAVMKTAGRSYDATILVLDGGSTDKTVSKALDCGANIIVCPRKGKGNQLQYFKALRSVAQSVENVVPKRYRNDLLADFYVMLDSDNTYPPEYIPNILEKLFTYQVIIGNRTPVEKGAMHKWANKLFVLIANILFGTKQHDICTGMWGFTTDALDKIDITANGFELEANLFGQCIKKDLSIKEVDIPLYARHGSKSKINIMHSFIIIWTLIKERYTN